MCEVNPEQKSKCMYEKWGKNTIPTVTENILWMHGVRITMVRPVYKNIEITWVHFKSTLQMHSIKYHVHQAVHNILVCGQ